MAALIVAVTVGFVAVFAGAVTGLEWLLNRVDRWWGEW